MAAGGPPSSGEAPARPFDPAAAAADDLVYKIEVWASGGAAPELLVAATTTASLGYAAYYAAAREFPGRDISLRCGTAVLSRWTGRR